MMMFIARPNLEVLRTTVLSNAGSFRRPHVLWRRRPAVHLFMLAVLLFQGVIRAHPSRLTGYHSKTSPTSTLLWQSDKSSNNADDNLIPISSLQVPPYVKVVDYTGRGAVTLTTGGALTADPQKPVVIVLADELILVDQDFDY